MWNNYVTTQISQTEILEQLHLSAMYSLRKKYASNFAARSQITTNFVIHSKNTFNDKMIKILHAISHTTLYLIITCEQN